MMTLTRQVDKPKRLLECNFICTKNCLEFLFLLWLHYMTEKLFMWKRNKNRWETFLCLTKNWIMKISFCGFLSWFQMRYFFWKKIYIEELSDEFWWIDWIDWICLRFDQKYLKWLKNLFEFQSKTKKSFNKSSPFLINFKIFNWNPHEYTSIQKISETHTCWALMRLSCSQTNSINLLFLLNWNLFPQAFTYTNMRKICNGKAEKIVRENWCKTEIIKNEKKIQ